MRHKYGARSIVLSRSVVGEASVFVMVLTQDTNQIMDRLYELGARAILVSPIHAARI